MKTLKAIDIKTVLFLDIETVPIRESYDDLPDYVQKEWLYKHKFKDGFPATHEDVRSHLSNLWTAKAALSPEFSKIVCIVVGYVHNGTTFRHKAYTGQNEGELLYNFANDLHNFIKVRPDLKLSGHYINGFDIPFMAKRLMINRIALPDILDMAGRKPWEVPHIDTHALWKCGGTDSASLSAIAMAFGLPSPKEDLDGSQVAGAYYRGEYDRIAEYCAKDVIAQFNVVLCMRGEIPFTELQIEKAE